MLQYTPQTIMSAVKIAKTQDNFDKSIFKAVPDQVISRVLHRLQYQEASQFSILDRSFNKAIAIAPCLHKHVKDWSCDDLPSLCAMDQSTCKLSIKPVYSDILFHDEDGKPHVVRKTTETSHCTSQLCKCKKFKKIGSASYLFVPELWKNIFGRNDVRAAEYLLSTSGDISSNIKIMTGRCNAPRDADIHLSACDLNHIGSAEMWCVIDAFAKKQQPQTFSLQQCASEIYFHEKLAHQNYDQAESTLNDMIIAGVDSFILAMDVKSNSDLLEGLLQNMDAEMMRANPIVQEFHSVKLLVTICCHDCALTLIMNYEISVYHEIIRQCVPELEDAIVRMLQRTFATADYDERNYLDGEGRTVLEVLYAIRPLNRRLLVFFNQWKHDHEEFFG